MTGTTGEQSARAIPEAIAGSLAGLGRAELERMSVAGSEVRECERVLARGNLNLVGECLRGEATFYEYEHYPRGDVYDHHSHAQYYYHAHRGLDGEHGHFHTFLRAGGMPAGIRPLARAVEPAGGSGTGPLCHLVAVSMDRGGRAIGLFTTNRWVTGEDWYAARDAVRLVPRFVVDHAFPSWPLNRWLSAMLVLFRPDIEALLVARDQAIARWRVANPGVDALEARELEVLSATRICIESRCAALRAALG